ncbi:hypothetical protein ACLMJK_007487 [Lecanora helva]
MPYATIPSGKVFYSDLPSSISPPRATLLLHHGLGSTHAFYRPIIPFLTSAPYNYRCITYDAISCGLSAIATTPQSIHTLAQDAMDLLDALGVLEEENVVFVGHSIAGVVAAELAATRGAEQFAGVVMLGPVLPGGETIRETFSTRIKTVEKQGMEGLADTIPTSATGKKATSLMHAFIRSLVLSQKAEGYVSMCKVVAGAEPPAYGDVRIPTLLVAGDEDKSAPLGGCETVFERMGGEKGMEVMKGVGHWFCVEDGEETVRLIRVFVEGLLKDG